MQNDKLADFDVKIIVSKNKTYDGISGEDKLGITIKFLNNIFAELKENIALLRLKQIEQRLIDKNFESKLEVNEDGKSI